MKYRKKKTIIINYFTSPKPTAMLSFTRIGLASQRQLLRPSLVQAARSIKTIPQPPGYIVGTVNDAYVPPKPAKLHGSAHWTVERGVSIALIPLIGAAFVSPPSVVLDSTLSAFLLVHSWIGFQSCIIDYIPKRVYGNYHNYAMYLLTFGTGVAAYGVYEIEKKEEGGVIGIVGKLFTA